MDPAMKSVDLMAAEWVGAAELQVHAGGQIQPWRMPVAMLDFLDPRTRFQVGNPSGVRLRFASSTRRVVLEVDPEAKLTRWFDLMSGDERVGRVELAPGQTEAAFEGLPPGGKVLELWLNHMYAPVLVRALRIDADASFERAPPVRRKRILFHGSSISHGRQAAGPTESWPVGAARLAGLDPINLGVGGACRLEPAMSRFIRDQSADYLSFCLGANVVMGHSHNERAFRAGTIGLIQTVREGHPTTPLCIQGPIYSRRYETFEDAEAFSLTRCRRVLAEVVECFQRHGDRRIIYGGDLEMFGEEDEALLIDGVHPGVAGHPLMSRRYVEKVWPRLKALACVQS